MGRRIFERAPIPRYLFEDFGDDWECVPDCTMLRIIKLETIDKEVKRKTIPHCKNDENEYFELINCPRSLIHSLERIGTGNCIFIFKKNKYEWNILRINRGVSTILDSYWSHFENDLHG